MTVVPFPRRDQDEQWVKRAVFADRYDVSEKTVYRWQKAGMPHIQARGTVRYPLSECDAWLRNHPDRRTH